MDLRLPMMSSLERARWYTVPFMKKAFMLAILPGRYVSMQQKVIIIAEAGVNHNGSTELAKKLVDVAAKAGADYVKFQTFKSEKLTSRLAAKADYQQKTTGTNESQLQMLKKLELSG